MLAKSTQRLRDELVASIEKKRTIHDRRVIDALSAVPRHTFLPDVPTKDAYTDTAIAIKTNQDGEWISSASQPTMMAIMLDQLQVNPSQNILEIGTGTGYNAALLQYLVGEEGHVTSIELDTDLVRQAKDHLLRAGYGNVNIVQGNGVQGYAPRASYDRIISTAGARDISPYWIRQLKPDGRLVTPIWLDGIQVSATFVMQPDGTLYSEDNRPCAFVYLRGEGAGPNMHKQIGSTSLILLADEVNKIDAAATHILLSDDLEINNLSAPMTPYDYYDGFQIYLMLCEPPKAVFALWRIAKRQKAYGMEGRGIALFTPASAAFASYTEKGSVYTFAGSDSFLLMQSIFDGWLNENRPGISQLRLQLYPKEIGKPEIGEGILYIRTDSYLHAWLERKS